jgi:hypothetical protein
MASAFTGFAEAQWKWLDEQAGSHAFEAVHIAARSLRVSAEQVGAVDLADACGATEIAAAGRDAMAVAKSLRDVEREIANANRRPPCPRRSPNAFRVKLADPAYASARFGDSMTSTFAVAGEIRLAAVHQSAPFGRLRLVERVAVEVEDIVHGGFPVRGVGSENHVSEWRKSATDQFDLQSGITDSSTARTHADRCLTPYPIGNYRIRDHTL